MAIMCEECKCSINLEGKCGNGCEAELENARATLDAVAFKEGAVSALEWLEEVYGIGIHGTDAWTEYIGTVEGCECEWCEEEEE
jgi:hypothetical protein